MTHYRGLLYSWVETLDRWGVEHPAPKAKELISMMENHRYRYDGIPFDVALELTAFFVEDVLRNLFNWIDPDRRNPEPDENFQMAVRKLLDETFPKGKYQNPSDQSHRRDLILTQSFAAIFDYLEGYP